MPWNDRQKDLQKRRIPMRSRATKFANKLPEFLVSLETMTSEDKLVELEAKVIDMQRLKEELASIDKQIAELDEGNFNEDEWQVETDASSEYQVTVEKILLRLSTARKKFEATMEDDPTTSRYRSSSQDLSALLQQLIERTQPTQHQLPETRDKLSELLEKIVDVQQGSVSAAAVQQLPAVQMRQFHGDLIEFIPFWDEFKSTVHNKPGLSDVAKFRHLKDLVKGEAAAAIANIPLSEVNYVKAVEYLIQRFGNVEEIVLHIFSKLMDIEQTVKTSDPQKLRTFLDTINNYVITLTNLNLDPLYYSVILYPLLVRSLPKAMMLRFMSTVSTQASASESDEDERETAPKPQCDISLDCNLPQLFNSRFQELLSFLTREVQNLEKQQRVSASGRKDPPEDSRRPKGAKKHTHQTRQEKPHQDLLAYSTSGGQDHRKGSKSKTSNCIFCSGLHFSGNCTRQMSVSDRVARVSEFSGCKKCLRMHAGICARRVVCSLCKGEHFRIVCPNSNAPNPNSFSSASYLSASTPSGNLLPTGHLIAVRDDGSEVQARFLMDCGSQATYVSQALVDKLSLVPVFYQWSSIYVFGQRTRSTPQKLAVVRVPIKLKDII